MNILQRFEHWGDAHHPKWLDLIRIVLGAFLFYKGIDFLNNSSTITGPLSTKTSFGNFSIIVLSHYVVFAHILGGIMLMLGFFTRFACLIQIPIMIGAIFFISFASDVLKPYNELFISVIVLLLLCYFLVAGNGPWALKLKDNEKRHV
jgi:putative oxidoreductase